MRGTGGNKLRTYARFKVNVGQEAYLCANMKASARQLLCRFRVGVAPLQIELGRRQPGPGSRACLVCGAATEDEEHFLMACPLYDELRATLTSTVLASLQSETQSRQNQQLLRQWDRGTQAQRFDLLMALQDNDEVRALALYLEKAWDLRSSFLALQAAPQDTQDRWRHDYIDRDTSDSLDDSGRGSDSVDQPSFLIPRSPAVREVEVDHRRALDIGSDTDSEDTVVLEP